MAACAGAEPTPRPSPQVEAPRRVIRRAKASGVNMRARLQQRLSGVPDLRTDTVRELRLRDPLGLSGSCCMFAGAPSRRCGLCTGALDHYKSLTWSSLAITKHLRQCHKWPCLSHEPACVVRDSVPKERALLTMRLNFATAAVPTAVHVLNVFESLPRTAVCACSNACRLDTLGFVHGLLVASMQRQCAACT